MGYVLIIHSVKDYMAWKNIFDEAAAIRKAAGEVSYQVLSEENNLRKVVHFSLWKSLAGARAFFESPKLVDIRQKAGVEAPEFIYLNQCDAGTL